MSKKGKKGKKKIAGLMLFLGWMIFILLAVVFYFYFFSDLDLRQSDADGCTADEPDRLFLRDKCKSGYQFPDYRVLCSVGGLRSGQAEDLCYRSKPVR